MRQLGNNNNLSNLRLLLLLFSSLLGLLLGLLDRSGSLLGLLLDLLGLLLSFLGLNLELLGDNRSLLLCLLGLNLKLLGDNRSLFLSLLILNLKLLSIDSRLFLSLLGLNLKLLGDNRSLFLSLLGLNLKLLSIDSRFLLSLLSVLDLGSRIFDRLLGLLLSLLYRSSCLLGLLLRFLGLLLSLFFFVLSISHLVLSISLFLVLNKSYRLLGNLTLDADGSHRSLDLRNTLGLASYALGFLLRSDQVSLVDGDSSLGSELENHLASPSIFLHDFGVVRRSTSLLVLEVSTKTLFDSGCIDASLADIDTGLVALEEQSAGELDSTAAVLDGDARERELNVVLDDDRRHFTLLLLLTCYSLVIV